VIKLREFLQSESLEGNTILIKGSHAIGLEKVFDLL
jgi:UDP-N-acetylmuramyl pentapeptide synthase